MLNGCSAKEIDKERPNKSFFMDYSEPKVLAQNAIMMADCQKKPCGRPSCSGKPSGRH